MKRGDLRRYLNDTKEKAFIHGSKFYILAVLLFSNEAELLLNKRKRGKQPMPYHRVYSCLLRSSIQISPGQYYYLVIEPGNH
jgi:hypothetical protein